MPRANVFYTSVCALCKWTGGFDFFLKFKENRQGITTMKDFFKSFLAIMFISAAFVIGFQLGKEKEKQKIPKFQEDHSDIDATLE